MDFTEFEKKTRLVFNNKELLKQAFVHRSYINENKSSGLSHNERLEFLGDAVLELVITDFLYKKYTDKPEGELTDYRLLSKGESKDVGRARQYILANALEALIGAIYIDQGLATATDFIEKNFTPLIETIISAGSHVDAKSLFQEKAQEFDGITQSYKTMKETGPDHEKKFTVGVYVGKDLVAQGEGESKQDAEQVAARSALVVRGWQ